MLQWLSLPWVNLPSSLRSSCKTSPQAGPRGEVGARVSAVGDSREVWDLPVWEGGGPAFSGDWG